MKFKKLFLDNVVHDYEEFLELASEKLKDEFNEDWWNLSIKDQSEAEFYNEMKSYYSIKLYESF